MHMRNPLWYCIVHTFVPPSIREHVFTPCMYFTILCIVLYSPCIVEYIQYIETSGWQVLDTELVTVRQGE